MSKYPKLTRYVSEIDLDLQKFDKEHPALSLSQQQERDKYLKIYKKRDIVDKSEKPVVKTWGNF